MFIIGMPEWAKSQAYVLAHIAAERAYFVDAANTIAELLKKVEEGDDFEIFPAVFCR